VAGLKVFPAEVERVLRNSDDVAEVAVVGIPHPVLGEQVIAFVVLSGDPAKDTSAQLMRLRRHAQEQLAGYRMPADFQTIEELPRNASGKVLKTQLREIYAARTSTTKQPASTRAATGFDGHEHVSTSSVSPLLTPSLRAQLSAAYPAARRQLATEYLQHLVQSLTDCERLPGASERFVDIGMDSLSLVELTARLQAEVGPQPPLPATLAFDYPRVGELAEFLVQLLASPTTLPTGSAAPSAEASVEAMSEAEAEAALLRELED